MKIHKKILEAKKEIGAIEKNATNPFFKSKYFDINKLLEQVEPVLEKHGLLVMQPLKDGSVITEIIDTETGDEVSSDIPLPNIQDPQKMGSAITYYRRYTLQSLLGLGAEDDDGNKASGKGAKAEKMTKPKALELIEKTKDVNELVKVWQSLGAFQKDDSVIEASKAKKQSF